jgi:hypothetical protein
MLGVVRNRHPDSASVRRVLLGVADEVRERLREAIVIPRAAHVFAFHVEAATRKTLRHARRRHRARARRVAIPRSEP